MPEKRRGDRLIRRKRPMWGHESVVSKEEIFMYENVIMYPIFLYTGYTYKKKAVKLFFSLKKHFLKSKENREEE